MRADRSGERYIMRARYTKPAHIAATAPPGCDALWPHESGELYNQPANCESQQGIPFGILPIHEC